jgi:hypothetical protein
VIAMRFAEGKTIWEVAGELGAQRGRDQATPVSRSGEATNAVR